MTEKTEFTEESLGIKIKLPDNLRLNLVVFLVIYEQMIS
jgi:hypothetical protein